MKTAVDYEEPRLASWLFTSTNAAVIWLVVRLYFGYEWLHAGFEKVTGTEGGFWTWHFAYTNASWLRSTKPLQGFVGYAATSAAQGPHSAVNYGWYASFLQWLGHPGPAAVFSKGIALGEMAIGIGLDRGPVHRDRCIRRRNAHDVLRARRRGRRESRVLRVRGPADPGMEERRLLRRGSLHPAGGGNAVAQGKGVPALDPRGRVREPRLQEATEERGPSRAPFVVAGARDELETADGPSASHCGPFGIVSGSSDGGRPWVDRNAGRRR